MRKVPKNFRNSFTVATASLVAMSSAKSAVKYIEKARTKVQGRMFRGQVADHLTDPNTRFGAIYNRSCYQSRRGR